MSSPKALVDPIFINTTPDLVIVGKEAEYRVHRITFLCLSPYFQTLFRYDCHQNSDGYYRVDMKDVSESVFIQILNYAFYGEADVNESNVRQLLIAGDKYNIRAIIQFCQHFLRQNLDSDNCFETYLLAHYYNCEELKNFAANYILSNDLMTMSLKTEEMSETKVNVKNKSFMIYTASGFRTDIETLFAKFDEINSYKFKDFSKCFKDMKFGLIFRGRHNDNEMHEFIDECYLEVLYQLVNKDKRLSHRICSLYLLYALYVKQPLDQSLKTRFDVKVRITLDQLITIRQFIVYCKQNHYFDVCFVWYKLLSIGIDFVYYRYSSLGPSNTRSVNYYVFQNVNSSTDKLITDLKKSVESHLKSIESNHEIYVDFKDKVFDGNHNSLDSKPNIISQEFHNDSTNNLQKLVADFKYNREFRGRGRPSIWTPYRSEDNESERDLIGDQRRNNARRKAIKTKIKTENESIPHLLWSEDIIDSIKRAKERKVLKKKLKREIKKKGTPIKATPIKVTKVVKPKKTKKSKSVQ